ncbi:MAG: Dickkopf N-terminal cysteine-rich domain-containing protein [Myxococcota bacterium]
MWRITTGLVIGIALALGAGACGSEITADRAATLSDPTAAALALLEEPWCEPFAERVCAAADICHCGLAPGWPDDCHAVAMTQCRKDLAAAAAAFPDGFLVSTDGVPRCLELLDEQLALCAGPDQVRFPVECLLVVSPDGTSFPRSGERCTASSLCGRGLRCAFDFICRVPHPLFSSCFSDGDCEFPGVCRTTCDANGVCGATCVEPPRAGLGDSCGPFNGFSCNDGAQCARSTRQTCEAPTGTAVCQSDADCKADEFCGATATFEGPLCGPLPHIAEPCAGGFRCGPGLACDITNGFCAVLPGEGERCGFSELGPVACAAGLTCHNDGLCGPLGKLNEVCTFNAASCEDGLTCDFDGLGTPRCVPKKVVGDTCQSDLSCIDAAACDFSTFTCQLRHQEGERCDDKRPCLAGLDCVDVEPGDTRCATVDGEGDPCASRCPAGLRCTPEASSGTCLPPLCTSLRF